MGPPLFPRRFASMALVRPVGEGGTACVDLAVRGPGRRSQLCVVKRPLFLLEEGQGRREVSRRRFERETRVALALKHPALIEGLGAGRFRGEPFLVQEFIHGWSLAALAGVGELAVPLVLHVLSEVAGALGYLHAFDGEGLVHRDVAPANVMLSYEGVVKLIDFGTAKARYDESVTRVGRGFGRMEYAAPELNEGAPVDGRSDLFALGVVLWRLVAGRAGEDFFVKRCAVDVFPPVSQFNAGVAPVLDALVARSVAFDATARFQDGAEMKTAMRRLLPAGFDGRAAIVLALQQVTDVRRQRELLDEDVQEARAFLRRSHLRRRVGFLSILLLAGVSICGVWHQVYTGSLRARSATDADSREARTGSQALEMGVRRALGGRVEEARQRLRLAVHLLPSDELALAWLARVEGPDTKAERKPSRIPRELAKTP